MVQLLWKTLWKTVWEFPTKLNILLAYDSVTVLPGIYPNELKTYIYTKTLTHMFIAALLIMATSWKQLRCPSVGGWTNCVHPDK